MLCSLSAETSIPPRVAAVAIEGRGAAESALSVSRWLDLTRLILNHSRTVVYVKDLAGRYLYVNHRFEEVVGFRAEEVLGRTDLEIYNPETAEFIQANDRRVIASGGVEEFEETITTADGTLRSYLSIKEVVADESGKPFALCGLSTDITDWRRAEAAHRLEEQRYISLTEATAAIVWTLPSNGLALPVGNESWQEYTGQAPEELAGLGWSEVIHPDDREETLKGWLAAVAARSIYQAERRVRRRDGVYRDMSVRAIPILEPDGSVREWVGAEIDITDRKAAERALADARIHHEAAMAASGTGTFRWDLRSGHIEWDAQMYTLYGVPANFPVNPESVFQLIHEDDREPIRQSTVNLLAGKPELGRSQFRIRLPDGSIRWLTGRAAIFRDDLGQPTLMVGGTYDITPLKEAEERLAHRANHDQLTGLPNRMMLHARMEALVAAGTRFAYLLLDLNRFKEINDTYGHGYGDEVLRRLRPRLAETGVPADVIARLGGDEFGLLLLDADAAEEKAAAVSAALERPMFIDGRAMDVGASLGIALHPDHGRDVSTLQRVADIAMYAAKRARSGWKIYHPDLDQSNPRRMTMIGELRRAIDGHQLRLDYQPKIDLRTRREVGAEALVRWCHPRDGRLAPGEFIPLAEEIGLIHPLSLWVLGQALRDLASLPPSIGVAVNLAPDSLQEPGLVGAVVDLLNAHGADPRRLTIEVTETGMMRNPEQARKVLRELHDLGVRVAIDDFGTGYSSLAYLRDLPVDEVKVDQSFVKDMAANRRDACIVRAVIDLGHNLGLDVVAEGVEDQAALDLLAAWGCDIVQGFHLAGPLTIERLRERLEPPRAAFLSMHRRPPWPLKAAPGVDLDVPQTSRTY